MATKTLSDLLIQAVRSADSDDVSFQAEPVIEREEVNASVSPPDQEVEKVASALRFIGKRGVASFLSKEANEVEGYGGPDDTAKRRPGGGGSQADGASKPGTHHKSLVSNEAAINFDKKEKAKQVSPSLAAVLDAKPFSDAKLKENLSGASGKGDKNIHSKHAHDAEGVRMEIARRVAAQQGA